MDKVQVLIEGYARDLGDGSWEANSTTTLITTENGMRIVVDPGTRRDLLKDALQSVNLDFSAIEYVFLTHNHLDHVMNMALFPKAKIVDGETVYEGDRETGHKGKIPGTEVEIIATPGHTSGHASLLVHAPEGSVVVAGDVFWWMDGKQSPLGNEDLLNLPDEFAQDRDLLKKSREKVLKIADLVIPGHGKAFEIRH